MKKQTGAGVVSLSMKLLGIINVVLSQILSTARSDGGASLGPASTNYYCVCAGAEKQNMSISLCKF